jgi:hypothetical protein
VFLSGCCIETWGSTHARMTAGWRSDVFCVCVCVGCLQRRRLRWFVAQYTYRYAAVYIQLSSVSASVKRLTDFSSPYCLDCCEDGGRLDDAEGMGRYALLHDLKGTTPHCTESTL